MTRVLIAPSMLSADFGHLDRDVKIAEAAGADWIHVDVMDGRFVPNLTIGAGVTGALRAATELPLDVHLMIETPERLIPDFVQAGADRITVHVETCPHLHRVVQQIRDAGVQVGVALNPATPVESVREILPYLDLILVMTVNPGFGGQAFIPTSVEKLTRVSRMLSDAGRSDEVLVQVDGGIDVRTAPAVVEAGATVLVAGSAIFGAEGGPEAAIPALRSAAMGERGSGTGAPGS
jgi:ribulose-phosphate 3-epimerase